MRATPCCVVVMDHVGILVLLDAESFVGEGAYMPLLAQTERSR